MHAKEAGFITACEHPWNLQGGKAKAFALKPQNKTEKTRSVHDEVDDVGLQGRHCDPGIAAPRSKVGESKTSR